MLISIQTPNLNPLSTNMQTYVVSVMLCVCTLCVLELNYDCST